MTKGPLLEPHPTLDLAVSVFRLIGAKMAAPLLVVPARGVAVWATPACDPHPHLFEEVDESAIRRDRDKFERLIGVGADGSIHFCQGFTEDDDEYEVISAATDYLEMQKRKAN